ncbi:MAG: DPP IV N-terminal domain-containing protein [Candidatus Bipolaricaulis sp.]|nr:DPP IV N-terminal domain-containing protein [Candidatus Bipolaricaulis sp.]
MRRGVGIVVLGLAALVAVGGCSYFGSREPALTNWEPALSPDGTRLAFESLVDKHLELFVRDLATGSTERLTDNADEDWSPAWSPDARRIAFASSRGDNNDVYVLDLGTRDVARLTTDPGDDINPSWGSDGRIYFNSNRSGVWEIYAVNADGTGLVKLTETPSQGT